MPVPILVDAMAAKLVGDYLVSGKLLSYSYFVALLAVLLTLLKKLRCPWSLAMGLCAGLVVAETGLAASMNTHSEGLPVVLQIAAVGLILHRRERVATVGSAALASLAFVTKLTAVWAPTAIFLWLLRENQQRLRQFLAAYIVFMAAFVGTFAAMSGGRLFQIFDLSLAGITGRGGVPGIGLFIRAPYRFFLEAIPAALAGWALVPLVVGAAWWAFRERKMSIWVLSLGSYLAVLMVVFADWGTGWNQLLDLVVLCILVVGEWSGCVAKSPRLQPLLIGLLAVTVLWTNITGVAFLLGPEVQKSRDPAFLSTVTPQPLAGRASASTRLLSQDPYVPISVDQRPVVLDPWMLITVGQRDPSAVHQLVRRILNQEFDLVVLNTPLEDPSQAWRFKQSVFGESVADALSAKYVRSQRLSSYYVYTPAPTPGP